MVINVNIMNKQIVFRYSGKPESVMGQDILRILPNRFVDTVGPFTFLDHFPVTKILACLLYTSDAADDRRGV